MAPGNYTEEFALKLAAGTYKLDWIDPASGSVVGTDMFTHKGGRRIFTTPKHSVDIALRIKRS